MYSLDQLLIVQQVLELRNFPFDRQILRLEVYAESRLSVWPSDDDDPEYPHLFNMFKSSIAQIQRADWYLDTFVITSMGDIYERANGFYIELNVSRNPWFYVINLRLVNFIIVILSLTTKAVPYESFADRSSITLTLLLTSIAFKFVISTYVPPTPYLTYMDMYILAGLMVLGCVMLENFIVSYINRRIVDMVETIFYSVTTLIWILLHVSIAIASYSKLFYSSWECVKRKDESESQIIVAPYFGTFSKA